MNFSWKQPSGIDMRVVFERGERRVGSLARSEEGMNLAEAHEPDRAVGFQSAAIAGLDEPEREPSAETVERQHDEFIPDEPIKAVESDQAVGFYPAAIAGLSAATTTVPLAEELRQQLDDWDEFVTDDSEEGALTTELARVVANRIVNEVEFEGLRRQTVTVDAQGDGEGGILLVFDNLAQRRRILFEIPAFPFGVCLKVVGDDDMAKDCLHRDFRIRDLAADFRWLANE